MHPLSCFRSPAIVSDAFDCWLETMFCKRELVLLHHPHLQGWLRSNESKYSIWELRLWSPSKLPCRRWMILIWISRVVLSLMNIAVWWYALIFISLSMIFLQNISVRVTQVSPLSVWSLGSYEACGLGFVFFTYGVMMTFTGRFSKHLFGTQIFFIGGPFLQLVPMYLANTSPFWFLNSI